MYFKRESSHINQVHILATFHPICAQRMTCTWACEAVVGKYERSKDGRRRKICEERLVQVALHVWISHLRPQSARYIPNGWVAFNSCADCCYNDKWSCQRDNDARFGRYAPFEQEVATQENTRQCRAAWDDWTRYSSVFVDFCMGTKRIIFSVFLGFETFCLQSQWPLQELESRHQGEKLMLMHENAQVFRPMDAAFDLTQQYTTEPFLEQSASKKTIDAVKRQTKESPSSFTLNELIYISMFRGYLARERSPYLRHVITETWGPRYLLHTGLYFPSINIIIFVNYANFVAFSSYWFTWLIN